MTGLSKHDSKFTLKTFFYLLVFITVVSTFVLCLTQRRPVINRHQTSSSLIVLVNNSSSVVTPPPTTSTAVNGRTSTVDVTKVDGKLTLLSNGNTERKSGVSAIETAGVTTNPSGEGYWVGLHFSDQGTGAFWNLNTFLCLSSSVGGVRVVEPFLLGSNLGQNASAHWREQVPFSDVFDLDEFNSFVRSRGFGSLVPYHTFLANAPRKLVVAQYKCTTSHRCRTCGHKDVLEQGRIFSKLNGFEMVGNVCMDYGSTGKMTLGEFTSQLYSKYNKSEVVVVFPLFAGVTGKSEDFRLMMTLTKCNRGNLATISNIKPSQLVETSAGNYIQKYLKGGSYISVMLRFETIIRPQPQKRKAAIARRCLNRLHMKIDELKPKFGVTSTALCLDIGKYGSWYFRRFSEAMDAIFPSVNEFISQTVEEGLTLSDWEGMFTNTALRLNPGFIAVMQKAIAARGDVLLLVGGESSFQRSAKSAFTQSHSEDKVINLGMSCG